MTIYIDDDWNACASVRKMTWVNQLLGYETRQRTEARMTAGSLCTVSDRKNAMRSLYANSLMYDMKCCILPSAIVKKKMPINANVMTRPCHICPPRTTNTLTNTLQDSSNYDLIDHNQSYIRNVQKRKQPRTDPLVVLFSMLNFISSSNNECDCKIKSIDTDL